MQASAVLTNERVPHACAELIQPVLDVACGVPFLDRQLDGLAIVRELPRAFDRALHIGFVVVEPSRAEERIEQQDRDHQHGEDRQLHQLLHREATPVTNSVFRPVT
ncbi:MAG: hypothetical protein QM831_39340 [Kofleriaceae bacterium]